jgi:hypothetical protein
MNLAARVSLWGVSDHSVCLTTGTSSPAIDSLAHAFQAGIDA